MIPEPRVPNITAVELDAAQVPQAMRDHCSDLLVNLIRCRRTVSYLPWKCTEERNQYEGCQLDDYNRRRMIALAMKEEE
ncbi:hypothetical protein H696_01666 [Fonticula alba]|uniref:NADH dehydrogenase [ubiquinone] 1 beta subcomplex subunit 7 n=1 Tax=Fonticula alba TaxID=691883 RepID=A0A058ZD09_FONAL|nr:hypothetical protein H696_01666 [Fonticula alba]KCV72269.1 hypothetical protein H696_01666 [Fonticula alba]|eukprot:XP_009493847.1 hypothetical protein H696_01666 [Fonticula alba]